MLHVPFSLYSEAVKCDPLLPGPEILPMHGRCVLVDKLCIEEAVHRFEVGVAARAHAVVGGSATDLLHNRTAAWPCYWERLRAVDPKVVVLSY